MPMGSVSSVGSLSSMSSGHRGYGRGRCHAAACGGACWRSRTLVCGLEAEPPLRARVWPGYIGEFEVVDDHRAGKIVVDLIGRVNKCGVISPRFDVGSGELEQWVVNLLPARQFGHIILTTSYGIMDHEEAKRKHTGGKILGFFY
jgi:hypothetical protein